MRQQIDGISDAFLQKWDHQQRVAFVTGAGISQESGIQTYRGEGGMYDDEVAGDQVMDSLRYSSMKKNPNRTWRTIAGMCRQIGPAEPNAGHHAISRIEEKCRSFALLTQNVDGLHQLAGTQNTIDLHGDIRDLSCMECGEKVRLSPKEIARFSHSPKCVEHVIGSNCGGTLRPDVVLFEEMLPTKKLERVQREFYEEVPDVVICVGTSAQFAYIIEPIMLARGAGKLTVEINPERTALSSHVDHFIQAKAGDVLPQLAECL